MDETDPVLRQGASELNAIAPGMFKKKVATFVFLPWLCSYTERVREAAKRKNDRRSLPNCPTFRRKRGNLFWREESPGGRVSQR